MKYYFLSLLLSTVSCATKNSCQDYLASHATDPIFLQRSAEAAKPSKLPFATEQVTECRLAGQSMAVVRLRSDKERLNALTHFCLNVISQQRVNSLSQEEREACGVIMFMMQCLTSQEQSTTE